MEIVDKSFFVGSKSRLMFPVRKLVSGGTLFVEPQEYDDYAMLYGKGWHIVPLGKDNGGFGYLLNSMLQHADEEGMRNFFFCDDDVLGFKTPFGVNTTLRKLRVLMLRRDYAQIMLAFQGHEWFHKNKGGGDIKERIGAWCCILQNVKALMKVGGFDEELPIYNDWDMSARLIQAGCATACYYGGTFNHKMKSQQGGAMGIYKKQSRLDKAEKILRKRYGDECIYNKECHGQKEIRFRWNKLEVK